MSQFSKEQSEVSWADQTVLLRYWFVLLYCFTQKLIAIFIPNITCGMHGWFHAFSYVPIRPWSCMFSFMFAFMACISNNVVVEVVRVHVILSVSCCMSFHSDSRNIARNQDGRAFLFSSDETFPQCTGITIVQQWCPPFAIGPWSSSFRPPSISSRLVSRRECSSSTQ